MADLRNLNHRDQEISSQDFASYYGGFMNRYLFRWVDIRKRAVIRRVLAGGSRLRLLDLGCGQAAISAEFVRDHEVHGVDADSRTLAVAAARGVLTQVGTLEKTPFASGTFDAVVMIDSIEHVPSRERGFAEIRRLLKRDGALIAITPSYDSPLWNFAERVALLLSGRSSSGHISPYTREALEYWLRENFEEVEVGRLNFGMWLYAIARGVK